MTSGKYTLASLEAMTDRDLDAAVASVVFGESVRLAEFPGGASEWVMEQAVVLCYTAYWQGFQEIAERMQDLGFCWSAVYGQFGMLKVPTHSVMFSKGGVEYQYPLYSHQAPSALPRAAAIAAVLAVQGAA